MSKVSPIKLAPAFKDYLWGGVKLREKYNKKCDMTPLAESWEMSCHKDGQSVVASGEYAGKALSEYIAEVGEEVLGTRAEAFDYFPLLIKLIDAKDSLSIQVHPDDEYALRVEGEYGKSEMWYILEADEGAYIYYGFNRDITKDELAERIKNNTILEVLNKVPTKKGDAFFIKSGTVHAIGGGNVICEIQQNSNTTYRVYDYDRRDKDGNPRQLHVDKAIEVSNLRKAPQIGEAHADGVLAECNYFTVNKLELSGREKIEIDKASFRSVIIVDGGCLFRLGGEELKFEKGDSVFIPAQNAEAEVEGNAEIIISRI